MAQTGPRGVRAVNGRRAFARTRGSFPWRVAIPSARLEAVSRSEPPSAKGTNGPVETFGTEPGDAPVTRSDFERGLRAVNIGVADLRDDLHRLAAQVVALTDELTRRLDGGGDPARAMAGTVEEVVDATTRPILQQIQIATEEAGSTSRLHIAPVDDKYQVVLHDPPPCREILPICEGRCCALRFALSSQDLDEGVIRWDYGRPYLIRQRSSDGRCVHNHPEQHVCTVYEHRPAICRSYHCRDDTRIWKDYDRRILAEPHDLAKPDPVPSPPPDLARLVRRTQDRQLALLHESSAIHGTFSEVEPAPGIPERDARLPSRKPMT
jgi:Fe-S-cluster containining protein